MMRKLTGLTTKITLGIVCFMIGSILVLPIEAKVTNGGLTIKWLKKNYYSKKQSNSRFYTKTKTNTLLGSYLKSTTAESTYLTQTSASSSYYPTTGGTISGSVTANSFNLASASTKFLTIPASSFISESDIAAVYTPMLAYDTDSDLVAPIILPNGVTITAITLYYADSSIYDPQVNLLRRTLGSGEAATTMATAASSGTGGYGSASDTSILSGTIDNNSYVYYATITDAVASSSSVQALKITYSHTAL